MPRGRGNFGVVRPIEKKTVSICSGVRKNCQTDRDAVRGSREACVIWGTKRTSPFAAVKGDKTAMRPFVNII